MRILRAVAATARVIVLGATALVGVMLVSVTPALIVYRVYDTIFYSGLVVFSAVHGGFLLPLLGYAAALLLPQPLGALAGLALYAASLPFTVHGVCTMIAEAVAEIAGHSVEGCGEPPPRLEPIQDPTLVAAAACAVPYVTGHETTPILVLVAVVLAVHHAASTMLGG